MRADNLTYLVAKMHRFLHNGLEDCMQAAGVSVEQWRVLDRLREGEATVGELAEALGTSQQNVSKHVGVLTRAGLVIRRKDGNSVRCAIADASVLALCDQVCGGLQRQASELHALFGQGVVTPGR